MIGQQGAHGYEERTPIPELAVELRLLGSELSHQQAVLFDAGWLLVTGR
jgi:hypothetical protein